MPMVRKGRNEPQRWAETAKGQAGGKEANGPLRNLQRPFKSRLGTAPCTRSDQSSFDASV